MRFVSLILALATAGTLATDASAADEGGDAIVTYANCMARHHYREVAEALDSGFDQSFATALASVRNDKCNADSVSGVSAADLRAPLFASMYRRFGPRAGSSASNILSASGWVPALPEGDARAGWYAVSNCLVRREPDSTRALVKAAPGSTVAAGHLQRIVEVLPGCLPAGQEFRVTPALLAGLIAETVYQIDFATQYGEPKHPWGAF